MLEITDPRYVDPVKRGAMLASSPLVRGAVTGRKYSEGIFGADTDLTAYVAELRMQVDSVKQGDMQGLESMLVAQANTLDMIFNHLARKATYSEYLNQMQAHLSLALKAQAQCRATLEALAEIKNPRPVAFVKQANIAHGPQQVNNGRAPPEPREHARENSETPSNELVTNDNAPPLADGTSAEIRAGIEMAGPRVRSNSAGS
ncbi:hypothetical protein HDG34_003412 [Paraburkholderia sp. HC6.4b]|uniref:hypothetical protein n=1 Tax=unclassified Paraburkholderia TaxID=2615204 RepID=UPI001822A89C|nr:MULTISPECIES: hypothetical protein [unclassified Paraburkholderia]MBB5409470.1 hypothetical protein [Paraburkholderia sp. HC6.4b]MBB5451200.1 hypothetical protein [Paraburkholderia sp. Kb1A]